MPLIDKSANAALISCVGALLLFALSGTALADWTLNGTDSRLSFSFVKKEHIAETGAFAQLGGGIDPAGHAQVEIGLATVNTLVEIRDQRMQEFLFESKTYPLATYSAKLDPEVLKQALAADSGTQQIVTLNGTLDLHGVSKALNAEVIVTKTGPNRVAVDSGRPVIVNAGDFGLTAGLDKLQSIAGLPHIAHAVPVSFHLVFDIN